MDFGTNKTLIQLIKKGAFVGTYFSDIYSGKWYRKSWNKFNELKSVGKQCYGSNYYDVNVNKDGAKCGTPLRFWETESYIKSIDPYGWFQ